MSRAAKPRTREEPRIAAVPTKATRMMREELRRAERDREAHDLRHDQDDEHRADRAGDERADRRRRERLRGAAGLGHLVALEGGDDRGRLTGGVEQDRRRRPAVHAAVEDAAEQDQRLLDGQPVGDRQQQGHRHGRADAGEHPDGRAHDDPEQREEEVHRRDDVGEAAEQCGEVVHQRIPSRMPAGRLTPRPIAKP